MACALSHRAAISLAWQASSREWRLRVGDWRVRFTREQASRTVYVLRVLPRGRAYRD